MALPKITYDPWFHEDMTDFHLPELSDEPPRPEEGCAGTDIHSKTWVLMSLICGIVRQLAMIDSGLYSPLKPFQIFGGMVTKK